MSSRSPDRVPDRAGTGDLIAFARLPAIPLAEILAHMADPRVTVHMPLAAGAWDPERCAALVAAKEACWQRDGLGHWAILHHGTYAGWGGFQKEGDDWDFGLVLRPACFGLGPAVMRRALAFARGDSRIPHVTLLLPLSRGTPPPLRRLGARCLGTVDYGGHRFRQYRLETEGDLP